MPGRPTNPVCLNPAEQVMDQCRNRKVPDLNSRGWLECELGVRGEHQDARTDHRAVYLGTAYMWPNVGV